MKNLRNGATLEHRFRAADQVEKADMSTQELQYMYSDGTHHHFMNVQSYEMIELPDDALGEAAQWLSPNMVIMAEMFEGRPVGVELPAALEFEVVQTEASLAGATKTAMTKPAKLDNGVTVSVPAFIKQGDRIRVDPRESKYLERAK
jgi:elongation factor P